MDRTTLQKRIDAKAEKHFNQDLTDLIYFLDRNPISKDLEIKIGDKKMRLTALLLYNNYGLGNFFDVKKKLVEQYEEEEGDKVMEQLSGIEYLFNS